METRAKRKTPAIFSLVGGSIRDHNRFFWAVSGDEHIPGGGNGRALLVELNRRREVL